MSSGRLKIEFDNVAPATPQAGTSIIYPKGPSGDFFQKTPDGVEKQIALPTASDIGEIIRWDGTHWVSDVTKISFRKISQFLEDWGGNTGAGTNNWDQDTASGGSLSSTTAFPIANDRHYGRLRHRITTSSASRAGVDRGSPELSLTGGRIRVANSNWFATEFFSPTNNAEYQTGLGSQGSDVLASNQSDGVYFRVNKDGTVDCICSDGGINTEVNSVVTLLSERWYRFEITINEAGTSAEFSVFQTFQTGDPSVLIFTTTITSNLPPATANIGPYNILRNTAASVSTSIDVWQDYFYFAVEYSFER